MLHLYNCGEDFHEKEYSLDRLVTHSLLLQTRYAVKSLSPLHALNDIKSCAEWIKTHFSDMLTPREALLVTRAPIILGLDTNPAELWLKKNENVLDTRLDKNVKNILLCKRSP